MCAIHGAARPTWWPLCFADTHLNYMSMKISVCTAALIALIGGCAAPQSFRASTPRIQAGKTAANGSDHNAASATDESIQFAVIGDFGESGPAEAAVAKLVHSWQPEFIVTVGDNNYPRGAAETVDENIGQYYGNYIAFDPNYRGRFRAQGAKENRFFPALGNHDWCTSDLLPHYDTFCLPHNERYYQFTRGPVAFFIVDSDPHEPDGVASDSVQAQWLQAALADSRARFKIVVMHHPPYSSGHHGSSRWMQWPYKTWGASVVLAGHDHCYERLEVDGMPFIVNGAGGARMFRFPEAPQLPGAAIDVGYSKQHGAMHVFADRRTMTLNFINTDNECVDTLKLTP